MHGDEQLTMFPDAAPGPDPHPARDPGWTRRRDARRRRDELFDEILAECCGLCAHRVAEVLL